MNGLFSLLVVCNGNDYFCSYSMTILTEQRGYVFHVPTTMVISLSISSLLYCFSDGKDYANLNASFKLLSPICVYFRENWYMAVLAFCNAGNLTFVRLFKRLCFYHSTIRGKKAMFWLCAYIVLLNDCYFFFPSFSFLEFCYSSNFKVNSLQSN